MALSLEQTLAVSELARHLYDYLPGSSAWGTYTFATAASECGVDRFWPGGSKLPALTNLLERTLAESSGDFCPLIERIVTNGVKYRIKKRNPLTRPEIETLNGLLARLDFKIRELCDPRFLASLPEPPPDSGPQPLERETNDAARDRRRFEATLGELRARFLVLHVDADRNAAGRSLERVLNELFALFDLEPNEPFRVMGEQIDGSFLLDNEVYLLEAKWTEKPVPESDLLVFRGKIEGKSSFTRGLFISISGFTAPARQAITQGKRPTFVMMDGADLFCALEGHVRLGRILRAKVRYLAEKGDPHISMSELVAAGRV